MIIVKLCAIAIITAVCAVILKSQKSDLVPLVLTAGGILLILFAFDFFAESVEFLNKFTQQTNVDSSIIKLILKVIGVGYLIELTSSSVKDLGFSELSDKLLLCGKIIIFVMSIPVLNALFDVISKLISLS